MSSVLCLAMCVGYMHPFPEDQVDSPLSILIQRCWSLLPQERPTAKQIVKILEDMLSYGFTEHVKEITYSQVRYSLP